MQNKTSVRVYYEDTDMSGVVYHANYLRFFERGRSDYLRLSGIDHAALLKREEPLVLTLRRITTEFIIPAKIDDLLDVYTIGRDAKGARFFFSQEIKRGEEVLCTAEVEAACMNMEGRPRRLPKELIEFFNKSTGQG